MNEIQNKKIPFSVMLRSDAYQNMINQTLGDTDTAKRFVAEITTCVALNQRLQDCSTKTILSAGLTAQSLNLPLSPTLGMCYIIPYGNSAQFQIGWKGLVQLAIRTSQYKSIGVNVVRKGEYKGRDKFGEPIIEFDEDEDLNKDIIGYHAYFELTSGFNKALYWSKEKCDQHAKKYSKSYGNHSSTDNWTNQFDTMALKTVLKQLIDKWGVKSTELIKAIQYDQAVIDDKKITYVDNEVSEKTEFVDDNSDLTTDKNKEEDISKLL